MTQNNPSELGKTPSKESIISVAKLIVSGITHEVLLFAGLFGLIILLIGMRDLEVIKALRWLLLLIFVVGLIGFMIVHLVRPRRPQIREWLGPGFGEMLPSRTWTSEVFKKLTGDEKSIRVLAISAMTAMIDISIQKCLAPLKNADIKWLLLDPNPNGVGVLSRVKENPIRDAAGLVHHIKSGLALICSAKQDTNYKNFEIRLYDEHPVIRLLIVDDTAYFSYYPKGPAHTVPVYMSGVEGLRIKTSQFLLLLVSYSHKGLLPDNIFFSHIITHDR